MRILPKNVPQTGNGAKTPGDKLDQRVVIRRYPRLEFLELTRSGQSTIIAAYNILHLSGQQTEGNNVIQDRYEDQASRFKLLGHPVRLQILDALRRNPECVCHLEALLGKPQPYISQQLRVLREAGVIVDNKEGLNVYYHLIDAEVAALLNAALGPALPGQPGSRQRLAECVCPKCAVPARQEIVLIKA